jgi:hypothetical protein
MNERSGLIDFLTGDGKIAVALALLMLLLELAFITQYDYFRDELYYLASTRHLAFGYVDHPTLSIALLALVKTLLGNSLVAVRLLPAVAGALTVLVAIVLCRRLGGGRFAQTVTGLATIFCGYLAIHHYYSMNSFDLLFWALAFLLLTEALEKGSRRAWILLGLVLGVGLLNKISFLWLGFGLLVGLLLTAHRRALKTIGPWLAGALAAVLSTPYVLWQIFHGWPTLEFMKNAATGKMVSVTPVEFFSRQVGFMNPIHAPIWILGLGFLLFVRRFRQWRIFAWIYLTVATVLILAGQSKAFYLGPAYPPLLAAGAVALEGLLARKGWGWGREAVLAVMILGGMVLTPMALPVLPPEVFIQYSDALGLRPPPEEHHEQSELPQQYADQFGWREMAGTVAYVYRGLPEEERARCGIFGRNYGEAGAIDLFGRRLGLPGAISPHNSYWFWGPGETDFEVMIVIGGTRERLLEGFEEVIQAATVRSRYAMPYENNLPVFIARQPRRPLAEIWPSLRVFT